MISKKADVLTRNQKEKVIKLYLEGKSPKEIIMEHNFNQSSVEHHIHKYLVKNKFKLHSLFKPLGHKSVPYYRTESEMLNEPVYTYESLSLSEKNIYDHESRNNK